MPPPSLSWALWPLGLLAVIVAWLAVTAPTASREPIAVTSTEQADVTEKYLRLSDGRTVTCLLFPTSPPAVSCHWR